MERIRFGSTGLSVTRTGFGALPIQRLGMEEAAGLARAAYDRGIRLFDTARVYTDSEEKLGRALKPVRADLVIATKTAAKDGAQLTRDLETSLRMLKTDYIDIYQFHNPDFVPEPGGADGLYDAALAAKRAGKIRFIGITQHSLPLAGRAIDSGLYDTLQYPFNHLSTPEEVAMVRRCGEKGMGFLAMKAMSGGLIRDARLPFVFLRGFEHVAPIYGMQRMSELEQFARLEACPPEMDEEMLREIERDRAELSGAFCRGCGYCLPCPQGIPIDMVNRLKQMLTRSPVAPYMTEEMAGRIGLAENCTACGACEKRCPYHLKPYETLKGHLEFYRALREKWLAAGK